MASEDLKQRLITIASDGGSQQRVLEAIQSHVDDIHRGITVSSLSARAQQQLQSLLELPQAAREGIAHRFIVHGLAYTNMRQRFQMVDETHYQTFRWILEEGMDNDSQRLSDARKLFTDWLADGDGIFHIAGKLGSGKSTLMKFLRDHPRTKADLRKWAGTYPVPLR